MAIYQYIIIANSQTFQYCNNSQLLLCFLFSFGCGTADFYTFFLFQAGFSFHSGNIHGARYSCDG